jgi:hypothetical protein
MLNTYVMGHPAVVVCSPNRIELVNGQWKLEDITVEFMRARLNLQPLWNRNHQELIVDGLEVGKARNAAAQEAVKVGAEYLFFIDNDVILKPQTLNRLVWLADNWPDYGIFSGVYCTKTPNSVPLIFKKVENPGHGEVFWDWTPGDLLKDDILGCGMGCCLIRVSLLKAMLDKYPDAPLFETVPPTINGKGCSEDIWFCTRARLEFNSKIMIDTSLICNHIDKLTGTMYGLPADSLPARNYYAKYPQELPNEEDQRREEIECTTEGNETTSNTESIIHN